MVRPMNRADPLFKLRLPRDIREKLETAAMVSGRSLTAEILTRLAATLPAEPDRLAALEAEVEAMKARLAALERQLAGRDVPRK